MLPMNRVALWILAQIIFLISAQAVPPVLNYAGQVAVNGEAFDGNGLFKFALVNADGTTTYWSNDGTSVDGSEPQASVAVPVNGGLYAVLLGNTAQQGMGAIDPALFAQHTDAKLRVWFSDGVNGFQQLSPDRPFASVPYAFSAGSAFIANGSISKSMLGIDVMADLNRTVTYNRLAPSAIHAISSASLSSITNGKIKIVPFGQNPPTSYYLYHRAKAENLNWKFTPSSPSPGATFDKTIIYNDRVITMGKENGFQQDPVLSNWTNFYSVNNSIGSYSTALLSDNVYLIGGHDGNSKSNRLRIFNLINSSFSEGAPTPVAAQHKTAQALNGKIFEMGGWKSGNGGSRRTFCYDPVLDEWTEKSLTNYGRIHSASIVFQNKLWVIGGENNSADKVESYDTTNNNWTIEKSLTQGRKQASCWVFRDFLFVGGGKDVNGTILDSIECYDPRTETWHDWGQLPNPVSSCASFVVGDILHIFDGVGNAGVLSLDLNKSTSTLNDIYIQDLNVSAGKALVQAEVADGSVTGSKIASKTIGKDQISDSILKYFKPEITSQPQAQTVFADSNISYSVTAEGKYLTYQWKKDGVDLTGETNATLNITDANATLHDGNYSVVVSNDFGSVQSGVTEIVVATTWIPLALPRLELWLDASDVSSVIKDSNNLVSELRDKSSNKFHAVQSNVSRQPTYTASNSLLNNKPSVLSTSAFGSIGLRTPLITFQEIFIVANYKGGIETSFVDYNTLLAGGGYNGAYRIMGQRNSPNWNLEGAFNDGGNFKNATTDSSITILPLPPTVLRFVSSSAKSQNTGILYNPLFNDRGWVGGIGEIVALESLSSISDRQKIEGYLAHKWGLAASLPTGHPYKDTAP